MRTARGRAYELSGLAVINYGTVTGLLLVIVLGAVVGFLIAIGHAIF